MADARPGYTPFETETPPAGEGGGAATVVGLVVLAAIVFVVVSVARALLAGFGAPDDAPRPAPSPPAIVDTPPSIAQLRPRGELYGEEVKVEASSLFADTVVFTGHVRNLGPGGRLVVRARAEFPDADKPAVAGEQDFAIVNAGSSEPYRIELKIDNVKRDQPVFSTEVHVP